VNAPFHLRANVEAMVWSRTYLDACLSVTRNQEVRVGSRGGVTTVSWLPDQRDLPVVATPDRATVWITVPDQAVPAGSDAAATRDHVVGVARAAFEVEAADQDQAEATRTGVRTLADHVLALLRQRHPEIMPLTLHLLAPTPACDAVLSIGEEHPPMPHELLAAYGVDPVWLVDGVGDALHSLTLRPVGGYARADRADPASLMRAVRAPGMERLLDGFAALLPSIARRHRLVP
jgi:hypothetical protein